MVGYAAFVEVKTRRKSDPSQPKLEEAVNREKRRGTQKMTTKSSKPWSYSLPRCCRSTIAVLMDRTEFRPRWSRVAEP